MVKDSPCGQPCHGPLAGSLAFAAVGSQAPAALAAFTPLELPTAQSFEAGMLTLALTGDDVCFSAVSPSSSSIS